MHMSGIGISLLVALPSFVPLGFTDYDTAVHLAMETRRDLVIYFRGNGELDGVLLHPEIKWYLQQYVFLCVPADFQYHGRRLLDHESFREMQGKPGLVVVNLHDPDSPNYQTVISAHPLVKSRYAWVPDYGPEQVRIILNLPNWLSLTQRSMLYAVSVHPEKPQSITGTPLPAMMAHCAHHSARQAQMQWQHHADLIAASSRVQQEAGIYLASASEVVAESWGMIFGGENVLEAAFSCVDAWRQSPGHWGAVSRPSRYFGYDIARGANGTWYATGFFGY
jgi:hypothetical protein